MSRDPKTLRSRSWFDSLEYYSFARRAYLRSEGLTRESFHGKPVIGICNSWSELNHCNIHLRTVAEAVIEGSMRIPAETPQPQS